MKPKYIDLHSREAVSLFCNLELKSKTPEDVRAIIGSRGFASLKDAMEALPEVKFPANIGEWADDVYTYGLIQQLLDRINRESLPFLDPKEHEELGSMLVRVAAGYDKKYEALAELEAPFSGDDICPGENEH